ncbi:MAG: outer membrane lipoprotein-sorting protein [Crocinitomix sp.]|jgi:outer membrane lipoprotein-sorting protein
MKMNNMKKGIGILMAVLFIGSAFGQDVKAKAILDKVSTKTKAYKTISIEFDLTISGEDIPVPITETGKAFLSGDKYKVELKDQDIYCDGVTLTTHLKEDEECYTSTVADNEEEGIVSPTEILTIWEDGYKYKYIKETTFKGIPVHHINIFPKDPKQSKYFAIILKIDKEKNEVVSALIKGKDGVNMRYTLTKFEHDQVFPAATFVFDRAKNPNVDCYDE